MKEINAKGIAVVALTLWICFGGGYTWLKQHYGSDAISSVPTTIINGAKTAIDNSGSRSVLVDRRIGSQTQIQLPTATMPTATPATVASGDIQGPKQKIVLKGIPDSARAPTPTAIPAWPRPSPISSDQYVFVNLGQPGANWWCVQIPSINKQACSADPYMVDNTKAQEDAARMMMSGIMKGEPIGTSRH